MNDAANQRWLALGLLLAVLALTGFGLIMPLVNQYIDSRNEQDDLVFRLRRYKQIVARKEAVQNNLDSITEQYANQSYLNNQDTEALASADLQETIKTMVAQAGGQLASTQVLPSKKDQGFVQIIVRVRLTADIEALRNILYELETAEPLIVIDQLDINPVRGSRNRTTQKIEPSNQLNVNFQAVSFMRGKHDES